MIKMIKMTGWVGWCVVGWVGVVGRGQIQFWVGVVEGVEEEGVEEWKGGGVPRPPHSTPSHPTTSGGVRGGGREGGEGAGEGGGRGANGDRCHPIHRI